MESGEQGLPWTSWFDTQYGYDGFYPNDGLDEQYERAATLGWTWRLRLDWDKN